MSAIVATGNGAAYYVAHALWLASLEGDGGRPADRRRPLRARRARALPLAPGDAVLAVSSSGEFRDVVEIAARAGARPCVAITADAGSSLAAAATATRAAARRRPARGDAHPGAVRAPTRAGSRCGPRSPATPSSPRVRRERAGGRRARGRRRRGVGGRRRSRASPPRAPPSSSAAAPAWAAALELALMLKEISRIPAEGVETREGATSAMFGLAPRPPDGLARPGGRPARRRGAAPVRGGRRDDAAAARRRRRATRGSRRSRRCPPPPRSRPGWRWPAGHDVDRPTWTDAYYETARGARREPSGSASSAAAASSGRRT